MDTSPEYIKMCEKAEEIQVDHSYANGDYVAYLRPKEGKLWAHPRGSNDREHWLRDPAPQVEMFLEDFYFTEDIEQIWLPHQDELQEMVKGKQTPQGLISSFSHFCNLEIVFTEGITNAYKEATPKRRKEYEQKLGRLYEHQEYVKQFTSMEQLWLAFCMSEKYNKIWSGTEWVVVNSKILKEG